MKKATEINVESRAVIILFISADAWLVSTMLTAITQDSFDACMASKLSCVIAVRVKAAQALSDVESKIIELAYNAA